MKALPWICLIGGAVAVVLPPHDWRDAFGYFGIVIGAIGLALEHRENRGRAS